MIKKSVIEDKIIKVSNLRVFYLDKFIGLNNKNLKKMLLSHDFDLESLYNYQYDFIFYCKKCGLWVENNTLFIKEGKKHKRRYVTKTYTEEIINIFIIINNKKIITENITNMYCDNVYSLIEDYINIIDVLE